MEDLGYGLKVESKRDRYVMNKQVLEKALVEASTRALLEMQEDIIRWVYEDVFPIIEQGAYEIYDDVLSLGTTATAQHKKPSSDKNHWAYKLGAALGKAIADSFDDIVNGR